MTSELLAHYRAGITINGLELDEILLAATQTGLSEEHGCPSDRLLQKTKDRIRAFLMQLPYDMQVQDILEIMEE
jgi:hypothetical protein